MTARLRSESHPLWMGEECKEVKSLLNIQFLRLTTPHHKGGDVFAVDRAVMPAPTDRQPDKSVFTCFRLGGQVFLVSFKENTEAFRILRQRGDGL